MDLSPLLLPELRELHQKVRAELKLRQTSSDKTANAEIYALADRLGISIRAIKEITIPEDGRRKSKRKKAKYRNPTNQNLTWTGQGRQPRWVAKHLAQGGQLKDLEAPRSSKASTSPPSPIDE
jgi:DNA-binding protein H-NS